MVGSGGGSVRRSREGRRAGLRDWQARAADDLGAVGNSDGSLRRGREVTELARIAGSGELLARAALCRAAVFSTVSDPGGAHGCCKRPWITRTTSGPAVAERNCWRRWPPCGGFPVWTVEPPTRQDATDRVSGSKLSSPEVSTRTTWCSTRCCRLRRPRLVRTASGWLEEYELLGGRVRRHAEPAYPANLLGRESGVREGSTPFAESRARRLESPGRSAWCEVLGMAGCSGTCRWRSFSVAALSRPRIGR